MRNLAVETTAFRDSERGFEVPRALCEVSPLSQCVRRAECSRPNLGSPGRQPSQAPLFRAATYPRQAKSELALTLRSGHRKAEHENLREKNYSI